MNVNNVVRGFIPELYTASVYRTLEDNLVMKKIAKAQIDAPIKKFGDTVYFTGLADPTITSYTGTLTPEELKDDQIAMLIDKTETFCFKVEDVDKLMANVDVKGSQTQRAAYNLAKKIDLDVFTNAGDDANAGDDLAVTVTSANVLSTVAELARMLYEQNVEESNIWMVIPPWMMLKLKIAGVSFSINEGINGKGGMKWTDDLGFEVFVTNNLYNSGSQASPVHTILAGSFQAIGFAERMLMTRNIEMEGSRSRQCDGGNVYGYKVIKPKELAVLVATLGAETTI